MLDQHDIVGEKAELWYEVRRAGGGEGGKQGGEGKDFFHRRQSRQLGINTGRDANGRGRRRNRAHA